MGGLTFILSSAHGSNNSLRVLEEEPATLNQHCKQKSWNSQGLDWLRSYVCSKLITVAWGKDSIARTDFRTHVLNLRIEKHKYKQGLFVRRKWEENECWEAIHWCSLQRQGWGLFSFFFFFFWLLWVFIAAHGLSLVAESGGYSLVVVCGLLIAVASPVETMSSRWMAQYLWYTGLVALGHVESSRNRYWNRVPCIGRWILNTGRLGKSECWGLNIVLRPVPEPCHPNDNLLWSCFP